MKENTTYFLNIQSTWSGHRDSAVGDLNTNFLQKETQNLLTHYCWFNLFLAL